VSALEVARAALAAADGDAEAAVLAERSGLARFACSEVHQPTLIENLVVTLRIARGGRLGSAATNRVDDEGLRALAARARDAAESASATDRMTPPPEREPLPDAGGFDDVTARLTPEDQAERAAAAIEASELPAYGFFTSGVTEVAVATTAGVAIEERLTDATALVIAAEDGASGYAEQSAWAERNVDPAAVAREAAEKATRTRGAGTIEPGRYAAVLEPYAVAELLGYFAFDSFGALGLMEERSYFSGRLGEHLFDPEITIADDPIAPVGFPKAFDFEGTPKRRVELVTEGTAVGVVWDRVTAARAGGDARTTGGAPPPSLREWGPLPFALSLAPGSAASLEELAEAIGEGICVTRLHYLSIVQPREGVITGMTRDGTFRIRAGRIAEPLVNLRFTVSVPELLAEVPGLTRDVKLVNGSDFYGERYPVGPLVPAVATARFTVTGTGSTPGL
jgi:PmbA protein